MHTSNEDRATGYFSAQTAKPQQDRQNHWLEKLIQVLAALFLAACLVMALATLPQRMGYGMGGQYAIMVYLPSLMFAVGGLLQWAILMAVAYILQYLCKIERNTAPTEAI